MTRKLALRHSDLKVWMPFFIANTKGGETMPNDFRQLLRLLEPDNLFLPKAIVARKDIIDQSKIMLGMVFTEHRFDTIADTKEALETITENDIIKEFGNNPQITKRIKADIGKITNNFDSIFGQGGTKI